MATVYSLVCWGGRTGKTVTMTIASPCVVTSTNHGLRDGTRLVFSTTGTLPTGITAGVTYYAKSTAANTFNLYTDEALTSIVDTSGTQSGTHTAKSVLTEEYFAQYAGRWGDAGSERCYDSIVSWHSARLSAGVSALDSEVCELGQSFVDIRSDSTVPTLSIAAATVNVISAIDGVRTEAFHFGQSEAGYELYRSASGYQLLVLSRPRTTVDGFSVTAFAGYYGNQALDLVGWGCVAKNMIVAPGTNTSTTMGIRLNTSLTKALNCKVSGCKQGVYMINYAPGLQVCNCTITGCATGMFPAAATNIYAEVYNNTSIGNTTNWGAITYNANTACAGNAGLSGEAWANNGNAQITVATTDFANFPTDMRPALSTSPQVDSGVEYYGALGYDISDSERPNYNNGGSEAFDVGCYEFDHGYGNHPASTTVTFSGVRAGSEVRIYDASGNELAGVESSAANPSLTWVLTAGDVRVQILSLDYKNLDFDYTPAAGVVTLPVQQAPDKWYSNP